MIITMSGLNIRLKLSKYKELINMNEIADLDPVSTIVLQESISVKSRADANNLLKLQAVLDYMYEKINIGNWKEVKPCFRKAITVASYLKLLEQVTVANLDAKLDMESLYHTIDHGLMFGCPLDKTPQLLQSCASELNKYCDKENSSTHRRTVVDCDIKCHLPLTGKQMPSQSLPSMETFFKNYIVTNKPVILEDCIKYWPALEKWKDVDYLLNCAGMRTIPVELGSKYTDSQWTQKLMSFKDFINMHILQKNTTIGYLAQYQLFQHIPELLNDIMVPEYCCLSETDNEIDINAWYGPKGTVSPLHYDSKRNLLAQVVGSKRIFLFPPSDTEFLYPHTDELLCNTAKVDPREPNLIEYPKFAKSSPYSCILNPGQILYIPPKWWHHVESLSISFSVSFWWE